MNVKESTIAYLKKVASKKMASEEEDFNAYDWYGGNMDDAFQGGWNDGAIDMAATILKMIEG